MRNYNNVWTDETPDISRIRAGSRKHPQFVSHESHMQLFECQIQQYVVQYQVYLIPGIIMILLWLLFSLPHRYNAVHGQRTGSINSGADDCRGRKTKRKTEDSTHNN